MSVAGADPGRRANALDAAAWRVLTDIDPRVAVPLLDALESEGVAAYVEPTLPPPGPYGDRPGPIEPTQRLYVDAERHEQARAVVAAELPGMVAELAGHDLAGDDAAFAAIVADFERSADTPVAPWPVDEDLLPIRGAPERDEPPVGRYRPDLGEELAQAYDEGHYQPPPPPALPTSTAPTRWAGLAVLAGLALIVLLPLLGTVPSDATMVLGVLLIVGGIATLVWRMRDAPPADDDPDSGAVV